MIRTQSKASAYQTTLTNGNDYALSDAPIAKGGGGKGFGPHELLEAAFATCLNMSVRMRAAERDLQVDDVHTEVRLDRSREKQTLFEYSIEVAGPLSDSERETLITEAAECPVKATLCKELVFSRVSRK